MDRKITQRYHKVSIRVIGGKQYDTAVAATQTYTTYKSKPIDT